MWLGTSWETISPWWLSFVNQMFFQAQFRPLQWDIWTEFPKGKLSPLARWRPTLSTCVMCQQGHRGGCSWCTTQKYMTKGASRGWIPACFCPVGPRGCVFPEDPFLGATTTLCLLVVALSFRISLAKPKCYHLAEWITTSHPPGRSD